jgi:putative resolvase
MYAIGTAASLLGVCIKTLRRWDEHKKISCVKTPGGHRRFPIQEISRFLKNSSLKEDKKSIEVQEKQVCAIYGRVSSHKQYKRGDLTRQVQQLQDHARDNEMPVYHIYKDVASGLNANRKNLWKLLRDARKGLFSYVLLTYKDRLTRFGFKYLQEYLAEFNVSLYYLHELDKKTPESEMVEDLVAIIHSFSGKLYRMRRSETHVLASA